MALPETEFNILDFILPEGADEAQIFEPIPEIGFYDNLAEGFLSEEEVERIGSMVVDSYEADKDSRAEWESMFEKGFELLGLKLTTASEPFEGACTAVHPLLIESAVKFQSKASEELFPPQGPVKAQIVGVPSQESEEQSYRVQTFMNYQLTEVMPEYFDEFERMLFHLPLVGSAFKKIYYDPASDRPVSEFVPVDQFYVSYNATDLRRADRYTHVIYMTPHELQKQIMSGMYRDIDLSEPSEFEPSSMSQTINSIMGIEFNAEYDKQYTLLEQHLYLELDGDEIPSPYIVTIEKDSGKVLSIRRNWNEGDFTREKKMFFTHYKYVPGFGFYGLGLIHFLGNLTMSATLAMRSLLDAGQFSNLPGGFKARGIRIVGGDDPIAPGEFKEVEATGMDLQKAIVPLPYKEPSQTLLQLLGVVTSAGQKFADSTDAVVADSTNYGPVGTTLALIEASAKLFSAIHKRLHKSQRDELRILARLNYEILPEERLIIPIPGQDLPVKRTDFDGRIDIIPVSDPNIPSQAHRLAQAQMLLQISAQTPPGTYNMTEVHRSLLSAAGIADPNRFLAPSQEPVPQDPVSDIISVSKGLPIAAFPGQDHAAYITVFTSFIEDPALGQNQQLQSMVPLLQAAIREHMMMQYQETMGGFLQGSSPDVMLEVMAEASQQILNANQQLGQYQTLEQQQLALESRSLELKEKGMNQDNAKELADLALKQQELDLRKRGQDIEAAKDIGQNTIRSQEATNKKDIQIQRFILDGLSKMRDISEKRAAEGFQEGGAVNFDDVIALVNSFDTKQLGTGSDIYPDEARASAEAAAAQRNNMFEAVQSLPEVKPLSPTDASMFEAVQSLPEVKPMVSEILPEEVEPTTASDELPAVPQDTDRESYPIPMLASVYGKSLDDTQAYIGAAENASRILTGHVPKNPDGSAMGDSGVTVSTGLDLGKQTDESLRNMGLDEALISKLSPFLGKTGQDALDLVNSEDENITLTDDEYDQIDRKLLEFEFNNLQNLWDSGSIRGMDPAGTLRWLDLTPAQRTVIQSVLRQYGKGGAPTFIGHASRGDWVNVINELDNFVNPDSGKEQYLSRREKDSNLLREELGLELVDLDGKD
jgi:chaperonin GroES